MCSFGIDQHVHRRPRRDVVEGQDLVVLVGLPARDLAGDDAAEDAARVSLSSSPHAGIGIGVFDDRFSQPRAMR